MAEYMSNQIIDFENRTINGYSVEDYFTFDTKKVYEYIQTCTEDFFDWYQIVNDDKLERISYSLYGSTDYWDMLILINNKDPLFDMPYNFDILDSIAESSVDEYNSLFFDSGLTDDHKEYMKEYYKTQLEKENEAKRVIKIVKPSRLQEFIQKAYETGCFK